jgi:transcriptional regulator with XRE-family HTH domain
MMTQQVINIHLIKSIVESRGGFKVAEIMGIAYNTLKAILAGKTLPRIDSLHNLALEMGMPISSFFVLDKSAEDLREESKPSTILIHFLKQAREDLANWNPSNTEDVILKMKIKSNLDNAMTATLGKAQEKKSTN